MAARRTVSVALETKTGVARKDIRETAADVRKLSAETKAAGKSLDQMAAEAAAAGRKLDGMADEAADASRGLDKLAEKAAKADRATAKLGAGVRISGRNFEHAKDQLGNLDRQIDQTVAHLKLLELQFASTGDASLLKQISASRSMIARLQKIRSDLTPTSPGSAGGFLNGLPATPVLIGAGAALATALAPTIGAVVGGAVMGGVGTGGVIGGIVAAAHDGRVKDAFGAAFENFAPARIGQSFIGPLLHEVDTFAVTANRAVDILQDGLGKLAPIVRPLALGIDGFVEALGPGLKNAFAAAGPALRAIANELPEIGAALSDMFDSISKEGDGATMGLLSILHAIEWLIRATGSFIGWLSGIYEWLVRTGNATTEWGLKVIDVAEALSILGGPIVMSAVDAAKSHLTALNTETDHLITGLDKAKDPTRDFSRNLEGTAESADEAAQKVKELNEAIDDQFRKVISIEEAHIRLQRQWMETVEVLKDGKRTLDITTKAGQDNKQALLDLVSAARAAYDAEVAKNGVTEAATRAYDAQLEALRKTAIGLHFTKQEVDALIGSVRSETLRKGVELAVRTPGLPAAQSRLDKVQATMNRLDGQVAIATVLIQELHREDARLYRRWGGVTEHAATGILRDPGIFSAAAPARYAFAEPATGGEAFVPRKGPYGRAMSILDHAAGWYGASVVPGGYGIRAGGGTQTVVHEHRHTVVIEGTGVMSGLRTEVNLLGGVQAALGPL